MPKSMFVIKQYIKGVPKCLIIQHFIPGYVALHLIVLEYSLFLFCIIYILLMLKYAIYGYLEYLQNCNKHDLW
jgi:hypothetical protein